MCIVCRNSHCMDCHTQMRRCPFCRSGYGVSSSALPRSTENITYHQTFEIMLEDDDYDEEEEEEAEENYGEVNYN